MLACVYLVRAWHVKAGVPLACLSYYTALLLQLRSAVPVVDLQKLPDNYHPSTAAFQEDEACTQATRFDLQIVRTMLADYGQDWGYSVVI